MILSDRSLREQIDAGRIVSEVVWVAPSLPGGSPPQLDTYTFSPTTRGMYGATPTGGPQ